MSPEIPHDTIISSEIATTPPPNQERGVEDVTESLYQQILAGRQTVDRIHDPEKRALVEQVQSALEEVGQGIHELHLLPHDKQLEALDEIVDAVFDQDEQAQNNIELIKAARLARKEDQIKELTAAQKAHYESLRRDLALVMGVEIQDIDKENEDYRAALMAKVEGAKGLSDEEIMVRLGFLAKDETTGELRFKYPKDAFPPHISEKWETYSLAVNEHVRAKNKFERALEDNAGEVVQLDALRRYAHNNLAKAVQDFLKLDSWDLERCRKFITKMIEERFPTVDTRESVVTSQAVLNRLRSVQALHDIVGEHHRTR